jgi:hypothetical protein
MPRQQQDCPDPWRGVVEQVLTACLCLCAGLAGFDIPLVYVNKDKLNQPIFGCNNLAGVTQDTAATRSSMSCTHPKSWLQSRSAA